MLLIALTSGGTTHASLRKGAVNTTCVESLGAYDKPRVQMQSYYEAARVISCMRA